MKFFEKLVSWFAGETKEPPKEIKTESVVEEDTPPEEVQDLQVTLPKEAQQLLSAIENQELQDLSDKVYLLAININGLLQVQKQNQELLVHISTLHEELINQLDQGKVVIVSRVRPSSQQEEDSDSPDIQAKKKHILN